MPEYRAYLVGHDGHFLSCEPIVSPDNSDATEKAERLVDGHDVELWCREGEGYATAAAPIIP